MFSEVYHSTLYDRTRPVGSFWETTVDPIQPTDFPPLTQPQTCAVAIIGAGFTGLSAALHLAQAGVDVRVLEAGVPAWGASGRNGGFSCVGATWLDYETLLARFGQSAVRLFYQQQQEGVELVRQLAAQEGIGIDAQGDGEIEVAHTAARARSLADDYDFFTDVAGYPCQLWSAKDLSEYAFRGPEAHSGLHIGVGFGLNPMKYARGLAAAVRRRDVPIHGQSPVQRWEKAGNRHLLHTPGGTLQAQQVILATNGYTGDRLQPRLSRSLLPVISNIITTRPLTPAELAAQGWCTETPIYDTRQLLFYFRLLADGRFLLGSRGGTVGSPAEGDRYRRWMVRRLGQMFPAWRGVEITHYWSGLVCGSRVLTPHLGTLPEDASVLHALAYHGNGVATGTWSGRAIAQWALNPASAEQISPVYCRPFQPFPLPALRPWYVRGLYQLYQVQDWF